MFFVYIVARISSLVPLVSAFLQSFNPVHVTNMSVPMFSMFADIVTLASLNLYVKFLGVYLSTKLAYGGELLM